MGPFKQTLRKRRMALFALGYNSIQVYNMTIAYKLSPPVTV